MASVDTVHLRLRLEECRESDFMGETPAYLSDVREHYDPHSQQRYITGSLENLRVSITPYNVIVKNSLPKFLLGNNVEELTRQGNKDAIEKLSDTLSLPMERAQVTSVHIGANLITEHAPCVYLPCLGQSSRCERMQQLDGVLYQSIGRARVRAMSFYDKAAESGSKRGELPPQYRGKNILRYELRQNKITKEFKKRMGCGAVSAAMLYDQDFFHRLNEYWKESYFRIRKLTDFTKVEFDIMKTKTDMKMAGVLLLIRSLGGVEGYNNMLCMQCKRGEITSKQKHDLLDLVHDASKYMSKMFDIENPTAELDRLVGESARLAV